MAAASTAEQATALVAQVGGLAILAGTLAAVVALVYRWAVREKVPSGLSLLVGLSAVAVYLNTTPTLGRVVSGTAPTGVEEALFNIAAFAVASAGAAAGHRLGDRLGEDVFLNGGVEATKDVGQLVRSVGRVVAVDLPEDIDDVVGYDPVPDQTKEALAGRRFLFPRNLTVEELRERLVTRLKTDYAVGHVDVELAADGSVEHLAVGSRAAGIGPTLPPATNAVAIRADPAHAASAGDLVQVWETDPMRRVLTAELRGVADDTVTVAIDAADTPKLDPRKEYRLVTLPVTDRPDREFASLLRAAEETFSSVTVEAGSPLHGMPVGSLALAVVSVRPESAEPVTLPDPTHVLAPGDTVFVVAQPAELRRLETAAQPLDPSLVRDIGKPRRPSEHRSAGDESVPEPAETAETRDPVDVDSGGEAEDTVTEPAAPPDTADGPPDAETPPTTAQAEEEAPGEDTGESDEAEEFNPPAAEDTSSDRATADAGPTDDEEDVGGKAGTGSFQQLKDEFESGEAEWAESEGEASTDAGATEAEAGTEDADEEARAPTDESTERPTDEDSTETGDESEADDGLQDLNIGGSADELTDLDQSEEGVDDLGIDDESGAADDLDEFGIDEAGDDELDDLGVDDADDELEALSFDEEDDDLSFGDEDGEDEEDDEDDDEGGDGDDGDGDDDDDDDDGGGGSSFQQLKEEFESGDADWADDIGSPGGDMRLDE